MFPRSSLAAAAAMMALAAPTRASAQDLIVDGTTVVLGGFHRYGVIQVINGGRIEVPPFDGADREGTGNLVLVADTIEVDATSVITARGAGYQVARCSDGDGPTPDAGGQGGCAVRDSGGGGAHFGVGGRGTKDCDRFGDPTSCQFPQEFEEDCGNSLDAGGTSCTATATCWDGDGEPTVAGQPFWHSIWEVEFGAAGGDKGCRDGDGFGSQPGVGGPGGGRIVLAGVTDGMTGYVSILGRVDAEGMRGCGTGNDSAGGGAGGSVLIVADEVLIGDGAIVTTGGGLGGDTRAGAVGQPDWQDCPAGAQTSGTCDDCGGGGGGGIINVMSRLATIAAGATFDVAGGLGGVCDICRGEAGGGAGELQLNIRYHGELCDGYDNDFDGLVDEDLGDWSCGLGACATTLPACEAGAPPLCEPAPGPDPTCMAPADCEEPRIAVILDTSASMLQDLDGYPTFGDGSVDHPGLDTDGGGTADDSRLYLAKEALADVISSYPEIDFALARYHQDTGLDQSCQLAAWIECAGIFATYDDPTDNSGPVVCDVETAPGVTVTVHRDSVAGEACINYAGSCGSSRRGADVLAGFGADPVDVVRWLDGRETDYSDDTTIGDHCAHSLGGDCEIRATGPTPLHGALEAIEDYIVPIMETDPCTACRGYSVILVTDGAESCGGDPATQALWLHDTYGIETFVIAVSVLAEERDALNTLAQSGSASTRDATFVNSPEDLITALTGIIAGTIRFEVCNGLDDDCDGEIDEGFPGLGDPCDDGELGACLGTGVIQCREDESGTACVITDPGEDPSAEVCNDLDDDCDGLVDEDLVCTEECVPEEEVCNGVDDDCDGLIDEDDPALGTPCGEEEGECEAGEIRCLRGELVCLGGVGPADEICNGLDDDCDGEIDEGFEFLCPDPEAICVDGECALPCGSGEFPCPPGKVCEEGYCVAGPCADVECAEGEVCMGGVCIELCAGVQCGEGFVCHEGLCVEDSCYALGCPEGQLCLEGECAADPCAGVSCAAGEFCRLGDCVASCAGVFCPAGQVCRDGSCRDDPCAEADCPAGEVCVEGSCGADPCRSLRCGPGRICVEGSCVDDPCLHVTCPTGERCVMGDCFDVDDGGEPLPPEVRGLATGGGGFSCSAAPGRRSAAPPLMLLLGLLGVLALRRRRHHLPLVGTATLALLLAACQVDPYCFVCLDGGGGDGGDAGDGGDGGDGGDLDGASDACVFEGEELCDDRDNDCDGAIDEGFDLSSDPANCGECGSVCTLPHAYGACVEGGCVIDRCDIGWVDLDGEDTTGCEYECLAFEGEACDGQDNDCDGEIDEAEDLPPPPAGLCRNTAGTPCEGVFPVCETRGSVSTWYCDYPSEVEFDPSIPNGIVLEEELCDGLDGDCDGAPDDAFAELGAACDNGEVGACRDVGEVRCDAADPASTTCDLSVAPDPVPGAPSAEVCNGVDDDCDGVVDNSDPTDPARILDDMAHVVTATLDFWIYRYEASRPDASDLDAGLTSARACSRPAVLPWTTVGFEAAAAACAAAGHRLCTDSEWTAACEGSLAPRFPYGDEYEPESCNGGDLDAVLGGPLDHEIAATGSFALCISEEDIADLSGNAKEWTDDERGTSAPPDSLPIYVTRGGSYLSPERGLECATHLSRATSDTALPSLGFRCCSSTGP